MSGSTNVGFRPTFLKTMGQLFEEPEPSLEDVDKLIFSNLRTPQNFPDGFGQIDDSITLVTKFMLTPDESEQVVVLDFLMHLLRHKWACKAFFQNAAAIKMMLERNPK